MMQSFSHSQIGRTENVKNCLDPKFSKPFTVSYYFEEVQKVKIAVYDLDNTTPSLGDDDFLGQIECTLGEVMDGVCVCVCVCVCVVVCMHMKVLH